MVLAIGTGAGVAYYHYQGQKILRAAVERELAKSFGELSVSVRSARVVGEEGIEIRGIRVVQPKLAGPAADLIYVDEAFVYCSTRIADLLDGKVDVRKVVLRRPQIKCTRMSDGMWSIAALVPPKGQSRNTPPIEVEDATFEIIEPSEDGTPRSLVLRDVSLNISEQPRDESDDGNPGLRDPLHVEGTLAGEYFEYIELYAVIDRDNMRWSAQGMLQGLRVSPNLWKALPSTALTRDPLLEAIQGRADLDFFSLDNGESAGDPLRYFVSGQLSSGSIRLEGMPEPLTEVQAAFQCDNQAIQVNDLVARYGKAEVFASATKHGLSSESPVSLTAAARNLQLDERLPEILPHVLQPIWEKFSPSGTVDADLTLKYDGNKWTPNLNVQCRDVSLAYHRLPYRVHHGTGEVRLVGNRMSVNLRTMAGDAPVRVEGQFENVGPGYTGELLVFVEDGGLIAVDEKLLQALEPDAQKIVRPLGARGWIRFVARVARRSPTAKPIPHVLVTLHDCSLQYDKFPYPIRQISGTLEMQGRHWSFRDLEGRNDSAYITCAGRWLPTETRGGQLTLDLAASDVPLEDELRNALNYDAQRVWIGLRPRGTIDHLTVGLTYRTHNRRLGLEVRAQKWPQSQNVEGRSITIDPESFPYRMDHVTGTLNYRDGVISLKGMRTTHGRVALSADGHCQVFDDGRWQLRFDRFTADRLTTDHELISALPPRLARAIDRLQLQGPLSVRGAFQLDGAGPDPDSLATQWDLLFDIENGSLGCGMKLDNIHGGVRLVGASQGQSFQASGELTIDSLMWQGLQFTQVQGPLLLDETQLLCGARAQRPRTSTDQLRRISARLFGGTFEADARAAFDEEGRYDIDARLISGDLAAAAQETMARQHKISGKAYGTLQLTGNCQGTHSLKGRGDVHLVDADIYELPVMVALLKILTIRRPNTTAFTESTIDYRIDGEHVYLDKIDFSGDAISLKGKGSIGLDRYIEGMEFYTLVGPDALRPPIIGSVLGQASKQLLVIRVAGSLDDPQTSKDAFPALKETVQRLFPEMATRREEQREAQSILPSARELFQGGLFHWRR